MNLLQGGVKGNVFMNTAIKLYNQKICITDMVRTQLYIFTQNSTLGIQLHVSALYIGHCQVVL
jgi:hypothetical protein